MVEHARAKGRAFRRIIGEYGCPHKDARELLSFAAHTVRLRHGQHHAPKPVLEFDRNGAATIHTPAGWDPEDRAAELMPLIGRALMAGDLVGVEDREAAGAAFVEGWHGQQPARHPSDSLPPIVGPRGLEIAPRIGLGGILVTFLALELHAIETRGVAVVEGPRGLDEWCPPEIRIGVEAGFAAIEAWAARGAFTDREEIKKEFGLTASGPAGPAHATALLAYLDFDGIIKTDTGLRIIQAGEQGVVVLRLADENDPRAVAEAYARIRAAGDVELGAQPVFAGRGGGRLLNVPGLARAYSEFLEGAIDRIAAKYADAFLAGAPVEPVS